MAEIKNTAYCRERKHQVPLDQMTWLNTANPGVRRTMCVECKNRIIAERNNISAALDGISL